MTLNMNINLEAPFPCLEAVRGFLTRIKVA